MCHTPTLGNEDHDKMHMKVVYKFWFWFEKLVWDLDRISALNFDLNLTHGVSDILNIMCAP
jgi:hypothetical protein